MTITLTILEELNAKSVIVNAHPKVNAYKLWAFTLSVDPFFCLESSTMSWVKSESRIVEVETGGEKEKG